MKHLYLSLALIFLSGCQGKKSTDNFTNINCDTFVVTDYAVSVLPEELEEKLNELEDEGAVVTEVTEPEDWNGKSVINYQIEQCDDNGNISDDDGNVSNSQNGDEFDY